MRRRRGYSSLFHSAFLARSVGTKANGRLPSDSLRKCSCGVQGPHNDAEVAEAEERCGIEEEVHCDIEEEEHCDIEEEERCGIEEEERCDIEEEEHCDIEEEERCGIEEEEHCDIEEEEHCDIEEEGHCDIEEEERGDIEEEEHCDIEEEERCDIEKEDARREGMASGMYSKSFPARLMFKTYGFERVDARREEEIVSRLRRHTNSSAAAAADADTASPDFLARRPIKAQHRCVCSKAGPEEVSAGAPQLDEFFVQRIFRRLQRSKTESSAARERAIFGDYLCPPPKPKERPRSAGARLEAAPEPRDARDAARQFEEAERGRRELAQLCRPTASSQLKKKGFCVFCAANEEAAASRWTYACPTCDVGALRRRQQERNRRLRVPTRASEGGLPLCERAPRDAAEALVGGALAGDKKPLWSGLPRSKSVRAITTRLHRPRSAPQPDRGPRDLVF